MRWARLGVLGYVVIWSYLPYYNLYSVAPPMVPPKMMASWFICEANSLIMNTWFNFPKFYYRLQIGESGGYSWLVFMSDCAFNINILSL